MEEKIIPLRYWNSNNVATAIVATANYYKDELFDWSAYIGGTTRTDREEDAYEDVAQWGAKLDVDAAMFFVEKHGLDLARECYRA